MTHLVQDLDGASWSRPGKLRHLLMTISAFMKIRWRIRSNIHMIQYSLKKTRNNGSRATAPTRMTTDPCPTSGHSGLPLVNTQGRIKTTSFDF
ncbi:hypothetical protein Zmor_009703 [Zophobas morio]|uniref:Uncharacterized protein n=1 Tax=Zophobas morio TaxID=2755281 RepID=A0AA38IPJ2_9CUCU|nr:hypothetical protein Zmor_009703 [Zophobas morio]